MEILNKLSKREKYLIYGLTLLLIIFIYINLIREPIKNNNYKNDILYDEKVYNSLIDERKKLNEDIKDINNELSKFNIEANRFGKFIKLEEYLNDKKLNSQSLSRVKKIENIEQDIYYIESKSEIELELAEIFELLNYIKDKNLQIEYLSIIRQDVDRFNVDLNLREYTISSIPFTGIVTTENFKEEKIENDNLLDELYGDKIDQEEVEKIYNKNFAKNSHSNISSENKVQNEELKKVEEKEIENINLKKMEDLVLDAILIEKDMENSKFVFSSDYLSNNKEIHIKNELFKIIEFLDKTQRILLTDGLDLEESPPKFLNFDDYYTFSFSGDQGSRLRLIFKDKNDEYHKFEVVKQYDDYQSVEFSLEYLKDLFPIELVKIEKIGDSDVSLKDFIIISK